MKNMIEIWGEMYFTENPYGPSIPSEFLYSSKIIRNYNRLGEKVHYKCLAEMKQNGFAIQCLTNDFNKESSHEKEDTISFTEIFHKLLENKKLCPSNYIVTIINSLKEYDTYNNVEHDFDFYLGTITRGMRAFASYLRELRLAEIIETVLGAYSKTFGIEFYMINTSVKDDMEQNTDIAFFYDGDIYRVWSYQTTSMGLQKTANRVRRAHGKGKNLMMPFNFEGRYQTEGWYLYSYTMVRPILYDCVINKVADKVVCYEVYREKVKNKYTVKSPVVFTV